MVAKTRVEALSDGLFAIVMTLLILEIKVPVEATSGELAAALMKDLNSWISFAITFTLAGIFWVDQHKVLAALSTISKANVFSTFLFLAFMSILPFSTSLLGHHLKERLALTIYFANQLGIATALAVQLEIGIVQRHIIPSTDITSIRFRLWSMCLMSISAVASAQLADLRYLCVGPFTLLVISKLARRIWKRNRPAD